MPSGSAVARTTSKHQRRRGGGLGRWLAATAVVAAGGPKADTLPAALAMIAEVVQSGARGATIGRNVWGFP